jgi:hypothetical protein
MGYSYHGQLLQKRIGQGWIADYKKIELNGIDIFTKRFFVNVT